MGQFLSKPSSTGRVVSKAGRTSAAMGPAEGAVGSSFGKENLFKFRDQQQERFLKQQQQQLARRPVRPPPPSTTPLDISAKNATAIAANDSTTDSGFMMDAKVQQKLGAQHDNNDSNDEQHELPPDLLQFLKDVGPLEKKIVKEKTSPRLVQALSETAEGNEKMVGTADAGRNPTRQPALTPVTTEKQLNKAAESRRERRDMRLVGNIEGFTTTRTTNFCNEPIVHDAKDFGLTDLDMYHLLLNYRGYHDENRPREEKEEERKKNKKNVPAAVAVTTSDDTGGLTTTAAAPLHETAKSAFLSSFYEQQDNVMTSNPYNDAVWTKEEQSNNLGLLKNALDYIELPVLVREKKHKNFCGLWNSHVKETNLEFLQVDLVEESKIKLVLADHAKESTSSRLDQITARRKQKEQQQEEETPEEEQAIVAAQENYQQEQQEQEQEQQQEKKKLKM